MTLLLLIFNDIILTASFDVIHESVMLELSYEFYKNDLGTLSYFLGIYFTKHAGGLFLSQKKYERKL